MKIAIRNAYNILPYFIRLAVSEETFTDFCIENKERFFGEEKPKSKAKKQVIKATSKPTKVIAKKSVSTKGTELLIYV